MAILRLTTTLHQATDVAWQTVPVVAWTTAEVLTGVIIASLSTLRPLVGRYMPAWATRAASKAATSTSYRLEGMPSRGAPGPSKSDRKSTLPYPSRAFSGGGWLDLSESDQEAGVISPVPARYEADTGQSHGSIRLTKEWSVHDSVVEGPEKF